MDTPPSSPPPVPAQQVILPPPKPSGCGCFAGGCLSLCVIAFVALIVLVAACWFFAFSAIKRFTSDAPSDVPTSMPSDGEFGAADARYSQLKNALRAHQATKVAFSASDLNALFARHSDFARRKNRVHVSMANSEMTLDVSTPLTSVHSPGLGHRWFNGRVRLSFSYDENGFDLEPQLVEANGHEITGGFLRWLCSEFFNRSFTFSFNESVKEEDEGSLWPRVKTISLEGDQLIVTTEGPPGT